MRAREGPLHRLHHVRAVRPPDLRHPLLPPARRRPAALRAQDQGRRRRRHRHARLRHARQPRHAGAPDQARARPARARRHSPGRQAGRRGGRSARRRRRRGRSRTCAGALEAHGMHVVDAAMPFAGASERRQAADVDELAGTLAGGAHAAAGLTAYIPGPGRLFGPRALYTRSSSASDCRSERCTCGAPLVGTPTQANHDFPCLISPIRVAGWCIVLLVHERGADAVPRGSCTAFVRVARLLRGALRAVVVRSHNRPPLTTVAPTVVPVPGEP